MAILNMDMSTDDGCWFREREKGDSQVGFTAERIIATVRKFDEIMSVWKEIGQTLIV